MCIRDSPHSGESGKKKLVREINKNLGQRNSEQTLLGKTNIGKGYGKHDLKESDMALKIILACRTISIKTSLG